MPFPLDEATTTTDTATHHLDQHNTANALLNDFQGWAFGGISVTNNASNTVVTDTATDYQITVFDTNSGSINATPDHTEDHITIDTAGTYLIMCSATVNSVGAGASVLQISVQKNNGASEVIAHMQRNLGGGGGEAGVISMSGIASLAASDTVELWIQNTDGTEDYLISNADLSVFRIGV